MTNTPNTAINTRNRLSHYVKSDGIVAHSLLDINWSATALGEPDAWPESLLFSLGFLYNANFPMLLVWGKDHLFFYNDAFSLLLNLERERAGKTGQHASEVWPEGWSKIKEPVDELLSGKSNNIELKLPFSILSKINPGLDDLTLALNPVAGAAKIPGVWATCTRSAWQPRTLKPDENEYRYRTLIEESTVATALYEGPDFRIRYANDIMLRLWGKDKSVIGKKLADALPELEGQLFVPLLRQVYTTGQPYIGKEDPGNLVVDGRLQTYYFNYTYKALRDPQGEIYAIHNMAIDVTELVLSRKKIEEAEEKTRLAIESAKLGVYEVDLLTNEMVTDLRFNQIWGNTSPQTRENLAAMLHPDDMDIRNKAHALSLQTGSLVYEARLVWKNGTEHWIRVNGQVLFDDQGKPLKLIGVIQDITEQILSREKILESEKRIRNMILQAPVAMAILRGPGYVVETSNLKMYELWGKEESELVNRPIFEGLPEARAQGFEDVLLQVYTTGQSFVANERPINLPRHGKLEKFYLNFVYQPQFDVDGSPSGIFVLAVDVTDQVTARQQVENLERRARLANDAAGLGIYEVDFEADTIVTDERFNEILQSKPIVGRQGWEQMFYAKDLLRVQKAFDEAMHSGFLDYEARVVTANDVLRWIKVRGSILFDEKGKPTRLLGVVQDINEQKQFAEELERKVVERTRELESANHQLQQTNIELNQFAYIASHDLQEPLRKVRTFTNILSASLDGASERVTTYMQKIQDSTERMQVLINDVLRFSLLSKEREKFEKVNLAHVLQLVLSDYDLLIEQKNAQVTYDELPEIEAIGLQMNQLFTNLISNALKFSDESKPLLLTITSCLASDEEKEKCNLPISSTYYQLNFTDNGIGFNQENAMQIFTIFQRLHARKDYSGTGIGLAMCKKIVTNHSGDIYATSTAGQGSVFTILLPEIQQTRFVLEA